MVIGQDSVWNHMVKCQDFFLKFIMVMGYVKGTKLWEDYIDNQV